MQKVKYIDLGEIDYGKAWEYQEEKLADVLEKKKENELIDSGFLLHCEHPHVFTLGKSGEQNNLLINDEFLKKINATYYQTNRGGDITYHGPGQLVGYPIFDLTLLKMGVKEYIYRIEESIIKLLSVYNIKGERLESATGVWLDVNTPNVRKICAIGVRVSKSVTMHGFALNVNTDLSYFSYINPCGFQDKGVTSLKKELGKIIDLKEIKQNLIEITKNEFDIEILT